MTQLELTYVPPLPVELQARIDEVRWTDLSDCERDVLDLLTNLVSGPRAGRQNALSIADMQRLMQRRGGYVWSDRVIKAAVKNLVEERGLPIGSSRCSDAPGYFYAVETADLEAAERPLRGEIISLAKRIRAFNPRSDFARHLAGQQELTGGEL